MTKPPIRSAGKRSGPASRATISTTAASTARARAEDPGAAFDDDAEAHAPSHDERRAREPRSENRQRARRRRVGGSLNVMAQMQMDCIPPECLDLENYVYRWVNDERGKLRLATKLDDYDFVEVSELGDGFDQEAFDGESSERCRMTVGTTKQGGPLYAYLVKKPREFFEADQNEIVDRRMAMMEGRVYLGATTEADETRPGGNDKYYVPAGVAIGHAGERRRGAISSSRLMKA